MWLQRSVAQIAGKTIISSEYAGTRKAVKLHLKVLSWNMSAMIGCRSLEEKIENANRNNLISIAFIPCDRNSITFTSRNGIPVGYRFCMPNFKLNP
jgi:hypothetical protein